MKLSKSFRSALLGVAALALSCSGAWANCTEVGGFAVFQCANLAFFAPPPTPITFDAAQRPNNISVMFWQLGFGNDNINNGVGSAGTGNSGATTFNGNDRGFLGVNIKDAQAATGNPLVPSGAICISTLNWADTGIDGCADNNRNATLSGSDDGLLNGYFDWYYQAQGLSGYYSLNWQQDYPMGVLLKTPAVPGSCDTSAFCDTSTLTCVGGPRNGANCNALRDLECGFCSGGAKANARCSTDHQCSDDSQARSFALAAIATVNRGSNGSPENCGGSNPAPCDLRPGFFDFADIANGQSNPAVSGRNNVIPWQPIPRPRAACIAGCSGTGNRTINFAWTAAKWFTDLSARPTTNPAMGGGLCVGPGCNGLTGDATRAPGVGALDVLKKANPTNNWQGLARYDLEVAPVSAANLDPNGKVNTASLTFAPVLAANCAQGCTDIPQGALGADGNPTAPDVTRTGVIAAPDSCFRVRVKFGKKQETPTTSTLNCRVGKCGDLGIGVASLDSSTITCVGGALLAGGIKADATRASGKINLSWETTAEVGWTGFDISAVTNKGNTLLKSVACTQCDNGLGATYTELLSSGSLKGAKSLQIDAKGSNPQSVQVPIQ